MNRSEQLIDFKSVSGDLPGEPRQSGLPGAQSSEHVQGRAWLLVPKADIFRPWDNSHRLSPGVRASLPRHREAKGTPEVNVL